MRVGNRLRKLREEKKLGVTKRLTKSKIDILQNYFGITLRQNIIWRIWEMQLLHHYTTFQITMKGARKQTIFGVNFKKIKLMAPIIQK